MRTELIKAEFAGAELLAELLIELLTELKAWVKI
jgi:hypothetical protein